MKIKLPLVCRPGGGRRRPSRESLSSNGRRRRPRGAARHGPRQFKPTKSIRRRPSEPERPEVAGEE